MFNVILLILLLFIIVLFIIYFYNRKEERLNALLLDSIQKREPSILLNEDKRKNVKCNKNNPEFIQMNKSMNIYKKDGEMNPNPPFDLAYNTYQEPKDYDPLLEKCQVPTLNTEQCYQSRFYECPVINGSFTQCTNNYIPEPKKYDADCGNRTFEMTPYPWKISENCLYHQIGFERG